MCLLLSYTTSHSLLPACSSLTLFYLTSSLCLVFAPSTDSRPRDAYDCPAHRSRGSIAPEVLDSSRWAEPGRPHALAAHAPGSPAHLHRVPLRLVLEESIESELHSPLALFALFALWMPPSWPSLAPSWRASQRDIVSVRSSPLVPLKRESTSPEEEQAASDASGASNACSTHGSSSAASDASIPVRILSHRKLFHSLDYRRTG